MTHVPTQGPKLDAIVLERVLSHIFKRNETLSEKGKRGTPICIWGTHGLKGVCVDVIEYVMMCWHA